MIDTNWTAGRTTEAAARLEGRDAAQIVNWALATFGAQTAIACSFSMEDVALVHLASQSGHPFRIVALDTGRLHEETLQVAEQLKERYGVPIEWYLPNQEALESFIRDKGSFSFRNSLEERKRCCQIRKIQPLRRALADCPAWMTGLRRDQGQTRTLLPVVDWDETFGGLVKINPLVDWNDEHLSALAREHNLPQNALYSNGFTSIGCAPCTRPTKPGEHPRAGRWWWEDPAHSECGLHPSGRRT
jgi:phosphoadenosine phosphosulfate reductase